MTDGVSAWSALPYPSPACGGVLFPTTRPRLPGRAERVPAAPASAGTINMGSDA